MADRVSYSLVIRRFLNPLFTFVTTKKRSLFFLDLKRYTSAGVSLFEAVVTMRRYTRNGHLRAVLDKMIAMVQAGRGIGDALALFPATFTEFELAMIDLGEQTGKLDLALSNISDKLKTDHMIKLKVLKGLSWPVLTFMVIAGVFMFMPMIGQQTPITVTPFRFVATILGIFSIVLAVKLIRATPGLGYTFDYFFGAIPFLGGVMKKAALARFATSFSYAYSSGSDIQETLRLAGRNSLNNVFRAETERVAAQIKKGVSLTDAFEDARMIPPLLKQIIAMGEKTGDFEEGMANITEYAKEEVDAAIDLMVKFGIVMLLLTGAAVVFFFALNFYKGQLEKGLEIMDRASPVRNR
ncbi:MAG: type II secretion system F family protein [Candidatus Coatesbacteria bacterium]|nr:type II secretion system F family protein [Candidatus Coatesbacteria bacterium]